MTDDTLFKSKHGIELTLTDANRAGNVLGNPAVLPELRAKEYIAKQLDALTDDALLAKVLEAGIGPGRAHAESREGRLSLLLFMVADEIIFAPVSQRRAMKVKKAKPQ